ncbi:MAG: MlaD family protein [Puniceicoccales bacterium]|jgi:hypothetical protein|nr:MlaD family protein [Puniceicoccales bacterium]
MNAVERLGLGVALAAISAVALSLGTIAFTVAHEKNETPFVLFFEDSVNGLSTDAPVKIFGVNVGKVKDIALRPPTVADEPARVAVTIVFDPHRPAKIGGLKDLADRRVLAEEIRVGLRGKLALLSPASGQTYIELTHSPRTPVRFAAAPAENLREIPVIPKRVSNEQMETYADKLLAFSKKDFAALERDWNTHLDAALIATEPARLRALNAQVLARLRAAKDLLASPELRRTCRDLNEQMAQLREKIGTGSASAANVAAGDDVVGGAGKAASAANVAGKVGVADKMASAAAEFAAVRETLATLGARLSEIAALLDADSPAVGGLRQQLSETAETAHRLREQTEQFEENHR